MKCVRDVAVIGTILIAAACGDNQPPTTGTGTTTGKVQLQVPATPDGVVAIHIAVTGSDFTGRVEADLMKQPDQSWTGTAVDVPPGTGRTVTAEGYDAGHHNTFEGIATNVTVLPGKLISIALTLKPTGQGPYPGNTPPHFVTLTHPDSILSNQTATLIAIADDPDANTQLTYSWSVLHGGGNLSVSSMVNQTPGDAVSTMYTPAAGFTGFALIQVAVSDGAATTTMSFPLAVGAGLVPIISFDVLPDLTMAIERRSLMPGGSTQIELDLTNPTKPWTPATMRVHTSWTDSCGGASSFDTATDTIDIDQGDTEIRTVTYTAPSTAVTGPNTCQITLTLTDDANVASTLTFKVWVDMPMAMFVSSQRVSPGSFHGQWALADQLCQDLADASSAPVGIYRALLGFDEISAKDRLIDAAYARVDGTPIANDKAELFSVALLHAVGTDENQVPVETLVFTGTNADGTTGDNCADWTSVSDDDAATVGISFVAANSGWTNSGVLSCAAQAPIYCVQQPDERPARP